MKQSKAFFCISVFLGLILSAYSSYAEEPHIFAAGIKITIGMDRDIILGTLGEKHNLTKYGEAGTDAWFVHDKKTNEVIAQVGFKSGSLNWASHDWRTFNESDRSFSMAKSLFALISNITKSEPVLATLSSKTLRGADVTAYSDAFRPPIPVHSGRPFRFIPATPQGEMRAALDN